jgi:hypothetical protein
MNRKLMKQSLLVVIVCIAFSLPCLGQTPPPNDNFSNRIVLTGSSVAFAGTLAGATLEAHEALGGYNTNQLAGTVSQSVWWTWTAPQTSLVTVELTSASADSQIPGGWPVDGIAVYDTTNVFTNVQPVAEMDLDVSILCEAMTFSAIGGSNYQIQLLGSSSTAYQFLVLATNSPLIFQPARSVTVSTNASTLFTVVAEGYRPLSYQWQLAGTNLAGQTAPMLVLTNIDGSQAGNYSVIVTNAGGAVTSAPVVLAVSGSDLQPSLMAVSGQFGQFMFELTGELGRNYRIESSVDLASWTNEYNFPRYPYSYIPGFNYDSPFLTSIVFNTNASSTFVMSNTSASKFLRAAQYQPANEICINNMRQIRFAKSLWRRDGNDKGTIRVRWNVPIGSDLAPYFLQGALPCCPLDPAQTFVTSYEPNNCQAAPQCAIFPGSHLLEEPTP